jgi:HAD superfamily hydrolase (TIGR01509 family)
MRSENSEVFTGSIYLNNTQQVLAVSTKTPIYETTDLVRFLRSSFKLAVVTNSEDEVANASLIQVGLRDHFDHIVSISSGLPPKPAPDLFIAAAKAMKTAANKILIFEDSHEGVQAGIKAGMDVAQVMPRHFANS